jgi:glycosyltransferase involved in cell wall biosynthesis
MAAETAPPQVSVIIIFLDAEPFLAEAIDSVLAQSLADWELLLVDDGSRDASPETARLYASARPDRIRYLVHEGRENRGMSASRNLGIRYARGRYLTFLDADDVLLPHALETLAGRLEAEPRAAMIYGPVQYWYSWAGGSARRGDYVQRLGVPREARIEPPALLLRFLTRRAAAPSGMLIRAEVLHQVGGFEDEFRGMYEDQALCAKICLTRPVLTSGAAVYRYRQHGSSSSAAADRSGEPEFGRGRFLSWLEGYLRSVGCTQRDVWKALRAEQWWLRHPRIHAFARRARRFSRRARGAWRSLLGTSGKR